RHVRLAAGSVTVYASDGVHHVPGRQPARRRAHGLAGLETPDARNDLPAFGQDLRTPAPVDRTVDTATAEQGRVRRIDDHVDFLLRNIALDQRESRASDPVFNAHLEESSSAGLRERACDG